MPPDSSLTAIGAITQLIAATDQGDPAARSQLFERPAPTCTSLAQSQLRRLSHPNMTLSPTAVPTAKFYLDMSGREGAQIPDRAFPRLRCCAMRGLIIDYVRERRAEAAGAFLT